MIHPRADERSARPAAPYPARCASGFAAELVNRWRSRIDGRDALRSPASGFDSAAQVARFRTPHFPSSRPSPAARPYRFGGEAARPPLPPIPFDAPHACCVSRRCPGAKAADPPARFASSTCASASWPTRFGAEAGRRIISRAAADFALPRSASDVRCAAEAVRRTISCAAADFAIFFCLLSVGSAGLPCTRSNLGPIQCNALPRSAFPPRAGRTGTVGDGER